MDITAKLVNEAANMRQQPSLPEIVVEQAIKEISVGAHTEAVRFYSPPSLRSVYEVAADIWQFYKTIEEVWNRHAGIAVVSSKTKYMVQAEVKDEIFHQRHESGKPVDWTALDERRLNYWVDHLLRYNTIDRIPPDMQENHHLWADLQGIPRSAPAKDVYCENCGDTVAVKHEGAWKCASCGQVVYHEYARVLVEIEAKDGEEIQR